MRHTQGNWDNIESDSNFCIVGEGMAICSANMDDSQEHPEESSANGKLIMAAPALLETCEKLIGIAPKLWGSDPEKWPKFMDRVENAVNKAKGE